MTLSCSYPFIYLKSKQVLFGQSAHKIITLKGCAYMKKINAATIPAWQCWPLYPDAHRQR